MLAEAFSEMTCEDVIAALVEADVPAGPVLTGEEAVVDPQVVHNETLIEWQHPDAGTVRQPRAAARFSKTPNDRDFTGAHRGQHNVAILESLGYSENEINNLQTNGVIG